jgi:hypothetical protein
MRARAVVLFLLAFILHSAGCAMRESGKKLMRVREGREPEIAPASQADKYDVAYLLAGTHHLVHLPGTGVKIAKGQILGFKHDESGGLVAVAGHKQFCVGQRNILAEYYCWYQRPRHDPMRDLQRFTNDSLKVAGAAMVITAGVALVGGVVILDLYIDEQLDRLDESNLEPTHHHHGDSGDNQDKKKKKKTAAK